MSQRSSEGVPSTTTTTERLQAHLKPYTDHLASFASSPRPAYSLAALFAVCAPFGFAVDVRRHVRVGGEQQEAIKRAAGRAVQAAAKRAPSSLPPYWQLAGFAATFCGGAYIIDQGDVLNGSGTVTAWSGIYLFFYGFRSLRRPSPLSLLLTASTAGLGLAVHGSYYFSESTWRGAVPGLSSKGNELVRSA